MFINVSDVLSGKVREIASHDMKTDQFLFMEIDMDSLFYFSLLLKYSLYFYLYFFVH